MRVTRDFVHFFQKPIPLILLLNEAKNSVKKFSKVLVKVLSWGYKNSGVIVKTQDLFRQMENCKLRDVSKMQSFCSNKQCVINVRTNLAKEA
jgi:hypothetical protein